MERQSLLRGALLLSAASLVMRAMQLVFQICISELLGADGLGRLQLVLTVGAFASVLASGGVRVSATCLIAEEAGNGCLAGIRAAVKCCCLYGFLTSAAVASALYFTAELIAENLLHDPDAVSCLRILAVSIPAGCLGSVLAGYFTAAGRIMELVGLELLERVASMGLFLVLTGPFGQAPFAALFLAAAVSSVGFLLAMVLRYLAVMSGTRANPAGPMLRRLVRLALPLGFNDVVRSGLGALENLLVPRGLQRYGSGREDALAAYGTIHGMVFPVILFPNILLHALSDLLIPEMAKSRALDRSARIRVLTGRCLKLTVLFSMAVAGLCYLLGDDLGWLLFRSQSAGMYIRVFSPLIILLYVDAVADGILKGLGQQLHTVRYNTLTSLLDVGLLLLLLPAKGIGGFLAAFAVSHGLNFYLSLGRLFKVTGIRPDYASVLRGALSCGIALWTVDQFHLPGGLLSLLWSGCAYCMLFLSLCLVTKTVGRADLLWVKALIRRELRSHVK